MIDFVVFVLLGYVNLGLFYWQSCWECVDVCFLWVVMFDWDCVFCNGWCFVFDWVVEVVCGFVLIVGYSFGMLIIVWWVICYVCLVVFVKVCGVLFVVLFDFVGLVFLVDVYGFGLVLYE